MERLTFTMALDGLEWISRIIILIKEGKLTKRKRQMHSLKQKMLQEVDNEGLIRAKRNIFAKSFCSIMKSLTTFPLFHPEIKRAHSL